MTRLSILIPCVAVDAPFESTLVSILQNRPRDCEVLVIHAQPYDDPYQLRDEVRFIAAPGKRSVAALVNAGIAAARGEVINVAPAGVEVEENWSEPALAHFADPEVGSVCPLIIHAEERTTIATLGVGYRTGGARISIGADEPLPRQRQLAARVIGPSAMGGFYAREVVAACGGFCVDLGDELADVDLALSLAHLGFRTVFEPASVMTATKAALGDAPAGFTHGRAAERLFWRHAAEQGWIAALPLHLLVVAQSLLGKLLAPRALGELLGRLAALADFGAVQRYDDLLTEAAARLDEPVAATDDISRASLRQKIEAEVKAAPLRRAA